MRIGGRSVPQRHSGEAADLAELSSSRAVASQLASACASFSTRALVVDRANAVNMGWPDAYLSLTHCAPDGGGWCIVVYYRFSSTLRRKYDGDRLI
jgi:hypothetical protein